MIVTSRQRQVALEAHALSLVTQSESVSMATSSYKNTVGQRTLSCRVQSTITVPEAGFYRFALPITPLLVQDKIIAWDQQIRDHYRTVGLDDAQQYYIFRGWTARVSCAAMNVSSHPFSPSVSVRSVQELLDQFNAPQSIGLRTRLV